MYTWIASTVFTGDTVLTYCTQPVIFSSFVPRARLFAQLYHPGGCDVYRYSLLVNQPNLGDKSKGKRFDKNIPVA